MPPSDPTPYYAERPGARLRRWVLLAAGLVLGAVLIKALGREAAPGDSLWLIFRWPLIAAALLVGPLVVWRLLRWRARQVPEDTREPRP